MTRSERSAPPLQLGIDVGSTTAKAVVMTVDGEVLWKDYRRHNAKQPEKVREFLLEIDERFPGRELSTFVTGSGGRAIAPSLNARYIQEVNAVTYAVETLCPDTGSAIELGGQDAKVVIWREDDQGRKSTLALMNDKCAGGTGATIDKILNKVGISPHEAAQVDPEGKTVHHIAAKCGVFAETDVVGLLKAGVAREEIVVSLCTAIVKQDLEVLVRGNMLRDRVVLLGGPHTFLPLFARIWRRFIPETWELHKWQPSALPLEELIYVPADSQFFAAIGAVLFGRKSEELHTNLHDGERPPRHRYSGIEPLNHYIEQGRVAQLESYGAVRDGLVAGDDEREEFERRYRIPSFEPPAIPRGRSVPCYIGIDGGSTSSKLVILDSNGELIYRDYVLSEGNPIVDVREMFRRIQSWTKRTGIELNIRGTAVTGYASEILHKAFELDSAVVETVAHMRAAVTSYGDIDIICDVGGQDIKVLFMKHGRVYDFKLNTQCSAGNGYFLQGMAQQFDIPIEQYADHAFRARKAPAFNYGCAVFMEQDKVNFQQLGWSKEEIMAGLALVLPLNIWNYVVQETNIARFGRRVLLQGGTQKNLAAVKAQVDFIKSKVPDAEVYVHKYADISGAIGAALEARESMGTAPTAFAGVDNAARVSFTSRNDDTTRCRFCGNRCPRTFIDITIRQNKSVRYISGYGCERGMSDNIQTMRAQEKRKRELRAEYPNLVDTAAHDAFRDYPFEPFPGHRRGFLSDNRALSRFSAREDIVVGIPRLLNLYYYAPFFSTYFRALGIGKIVYSDYTSQELWNKGNKWGAIDPCFPAKVAPAHAYNLMNKPEVTHICFPRITHLQSQVENTKGNNACPIQMGTPEVVRAAFTKGSDAFSAHGKTYWRPLVNLDRPREAAAMLLEYFGDRLHLTKKENAWAVRQGYRAMDQYVGTLRHEGSRLLSRLVENDKIGILLIGHPYHHDPGVNHGIPEEFQMRGFPVLCIESLPVDPAFRTALFGNEDGGKAGSMAVDDVWQRNFNRNINLKIWAAKVAARHPNLAVIDLSSFKCGFDAATYSYIDGILDASETPHFLFHDIDQNRPRATFALRIQTIEYFLRLEEKRLWEHSGSHASTAA